MPIFMVRVRKIVGEVDVTVIIIGLKMSMKVLMFDRDTESSGVE